METKSIRVIAICPILFYFIPSLFFFPHLFCPYLKKKKQNCVIFPKIKRIESSSPVLLGGVFSGVLVKCKTGPSQGLLGITPNANTSYTTTTIVMKVTKHERLRFISYTFPFGL